jgi:hypothetical protein
MSWKKLIFIMNFQRLLKISIIITFIFLPMIIFGEDLCSKIKKDYFDLKDSLKKPIDKALDKKNIDLNIANKLLYDYKLDELDKYIGDYSGSNVALNIISAKVNIYKGKYQKAMDRFNDILDRYPMHPEVNYLKDKLLDFLLNNSKSNLESAIIFRELGFPDKSLDILKSLVVNDESNKMWYEIAKTIWFCRMIIGNKTFKVYPYKDDVIAKAMEGKFKPKIEHEYSPLTDKNDTFRYLNQICENISLNSASWDEFLDDKGKQNIKQQLNDDCRSHKGLDLPSDLVNICITTSIMFELSVKIIFYFQDFIDCKNIREYASTIYVMKTDLGPSYYDIFKIAKDCKLDEIYGYGSKCIKTDFTNFIKMNLTDLFLITQENYLGIKSWNGPYLTLPDDDVYGYDYIYTENPEKNSYGVLSSGQDHTIDSFDDVQGDDKGLFISCSTIEK